MRQESLARLYIQNNFNEDKKMKFNGNFILKKIGDTFYAVPLGSISKEIKGMIKLNNTAAFIWQKIEDGISSEEIVNTLSNEFKTDKATAQKDFDEFTSALKEAKILV